MTQNVRGFEWLSGHLAQPGDGAHVLAPIFPA